MPSRGAKLSKAERLARRDARRAAAASDASDASAFEGRRAALLAHVSSQEWDAALALGPVITNPAAGLAAGLMEPPAWVMTDNGANLQKLSDQNSKLPDKAAQRVFDAGLEFASRGADATT